MERICNRCSFEIKRKDEKWRISHAFRSYVRCLKHSIKENVKMTLRCVCGCSGSMDLDKSEGIPGKNKSNNVNNFKIFTLIKGILVYFPETLQLFNYFYFIRGTPSLLLELRFEKTLYLPYMRKLMLKFRNDKLF